MKKFQKKFHIRGRGGRKKEEANKLGVNPHCTISFYKIWHDIGREID
jgi:hypothetical protein